MNFDAFESSTGDNLFQNIISLKIVDGKLNDSFQRRSKEVLHASWIVGNTTFLLIINKLHTITDDNQDHTTVMIKQCTMVLRMQYDKAILKQSITGNCVL